MTAPLMGRAEVLRAIERILLGYRDMLMLPADPEQAKLFAAYQAACRAALAHIEHLLKVAKLLGAGEEIADLPALIAEARANLPPEDDTDAEAATA